MRDVPTFSCTAITEAKKCFIMSQHFLDVSICNSTPVYWYNRMECIKVKSPISVKNLVGFIETWSMLQACKKKNPQTAEDLLLNTQKRSAWKVSWSWLRAEILKGHKEFELLTRKISSSSHTEVEHFSFCSYSLLKPRQLWSNLGQ